MLKKCVFCGNVEGDTALELDNEWRWCRVCRDRQKKEAGELARILQAKFTRREEAEMVARELLELIMRNTKLT